MPTLAYRARTASGEELTGEMRAASEAEARATLSVEGLEVLELGEVQGLGFLARFMPRLPKRRISLASLENFTTQMALMLKTGTPLVESVDALAEQITDQRLYDVLAAVRVDISSGTPLATALSAHPQVFDAFYVSAVRSGEASGNMPEVFERLAIDLLKRLEIRHSVVTALIYPLVVTVLAVVAVIFVMTFVLPRFVTIFEQGGVELPLPTRMMMGTSYFLVTYWYVVLAGLIGIPIAIYSYATRPRGAAVIDGMLLALPIVGPVVQTLQTSAMVRTLGTLLSSGVPLVEALDVARDACSNSRYRALVQSVTSGVTQGEDLAHRFNESALLSPSIKQMIATGERTGSLSLVLNAAADHLDVQSDRQVKSLSAVFEPLIIVAMGIVIGFIAVSVLLPLFRLTQAVRGG